MSVIAVAAVTKRFGETAAVDGVSLEVADGELLALLGPSGCGKTTLLRLIAGLERPDTGRVSIGGADMTAAPPYARPVNMMFQSYALFPHMTVAQNVAFGLKQEGLSGSALQTRVTEALTLLEMQDLAARKPHTLSGGQQQRVALARCLAKRPKALLLDEPLAALDKSLRERTQLELMALKRRLGIAFVFVTHDQDEAMTLATRVAVMDKGRILQIATPQELYTRPVSRTVAGFIGDMNLWDGVVTATGIDCVGLGVSLPVRTSFAPGTAVAVGLRPEQIGLGANTIQVPATVTDVIYRGATSTVVTRSASGAMIRATVTGPTPEIGAGITLSWPSDAMLVLT
jgi:putrescine transport system ATP-binding protein